MSLEARSVEARSLEARSLEAGSLSVRYGGVVANDEVSLSAPAGSVTGLIGPNGAGKTTFLDAVTGFVRSSGSVLLDGVEFAGLAAHVRARRGLARTWQSVELFDELTVAENVEVAAVRLSVGSMLGDLLRPARRRAESGPLRALEQVGLERFAQRRPAELSLGQQKLVGVARALASAPACLLLDEPAAGLDTGESRELGSRLRAIADAGTAVLLVDHDMDLVLDVCDRVYVLDFGRLIACGTPSEVRSDERVIAAYLGTGAVAA